MKTPEAIAKRFDGTTAADAEPFLTWFVSRERASLVGWAVIHLYATQKGTPKNILHNALKDDFEPAFIEAAVATKPAYVKWEPEDNRYFAFVCDTIRHSVPETSWLGEGRQERYARTRAVVQAELDELVARARVLVAERDALVA